MDVESPLDNFEESSSSSSSDEEQNQCTLKASTIFLANLSHEVRTPLNGIIGMIALLSETPLSEEQQDYLDMAKQSGYNLLHIINDILDYSKLAAGKLKLTEELFALRECIESANDILLPLCKENENELQVVFPWETSGGPEYFIGDYHRLRQVLVNVLSNAVKFTRKGTVSTAVSILTPWPGSPYSSLTPKLGADKTFVCFTIRDEGCGIAPKDQTKIFRSFSQLNLMGPGGVASKMQQEGTGLGLMICKQITQLMGGDIWLRDSQPGKGSTFEFAIQLRPVHDMESTGIGNAKSLRGNCCVCGPDVSRCCIEGKTALVVDDNTVNRIALCAMLMKWNMSTIPCSTADEALLYIKNRKDDIDIGLIDICMPKSDGAQLAKRIRAQAPSIPMVALSSIGDRIDDLGSLFVSHLTKPVKECKLRSVCCMTLNGNKKTDIIHHSDYLPPKNAPTIPRVLIAEDVYINQKVLLGMLHKLGYSDISVVENGEEVIQALKQQPSTRRFDILFLDIKMPVMDGISALRAIEKQGLPKPYSIALTALALKGEREYYLGLGFDDYISKPVQLDRLRRSLADYYTRQGKSH